MANHNYYSDILKIQVVRYLLKEESAISLLKVLIIPERRTISIWVS